jgi:hypothetical protein
VTHPISLTWSSAWINSSSTLGAASASATSEASRCGTARWWRRRALRATLRTSTVSSLAESSRSSINRRARGKLKNV